MGVSTENSALSRLSSSYWVDIEEIDQIRMPWSGEDGLNQGRLYRRGTMNKALRNIEKILWRDSRGEGLNIHLVQYCWVNKQLVNEWVHECKVTWNHSGERPHGQSESLRHRLPKVSMSQNLMAYIWNSVDWWQIQKKYIFLLSHEKKRFRWG